jgi:hypothetical protein
MLAELRRDASGDRRFDAVSLAVGRDYLDAAPVRGVRLTAAASSWKCVVVADSGEQQ